ncbi:unnamed protein product [Cuscuta europaea]|uniref:Uncharacterized protein n=1 Tax=Cuscuta europaea TaxID=41803 RepID=A0A9P1EEG8_CUSEU|nr:unnamed protein product [Cuscuta europaea]
MEVIPNSSSVHNSTELPPPSPKVPSSTLPHHQKTPSPKQRSPPEQKTPSPVHTPQKSKSPSPCKQHTPSRNRTPSPPPSPQHQSSPPQKPTHQSSPHQKTSHQKTKSATPPHKKTKSNSRAATPQRSSQHSVASKPKKGIPIRILSSDADNDGFLPSSLVADLTSKRRRTPPRDQSPQPTGRNPPLPKGKGLEMPGFTPAEPQITFNQFVASAEEFGGQMLDNVNKLIIINDKHYEHLTHTNINLEFGLQQISEKVATLTENLVTFMASSNAKVDAVSREVDGVNVVLFSHSQTLNKQNEKLKKISESIDTLQWYADQSSERFMEIQSLCNDHKEKASHLLKNDKERYQKLILIDTMIIKANYSIFCRQATESD